MIRLLALLVLLATGCTHWSHEPPVPLDQHKADLRACIGVAKGIPQPVVAGVPVVSPVNTAITGLAFAATIVEEVQFENRLGTCMAARGYWRAGLTTNIYGWSKR